MAKEFACLWGKPQIRDILSDEQYIGTYIAGKTKILEVGSGKAVKVDESEWIKIPNHHPTIIDKAVFDIAREYDIPFIASMHDFQGVPSRSAVARTVARARDAGAACIKIAALTETSRDLAKLVDCLDLVEGMPFALMGMGRFALASRVLFMQCGSCLNYGSLGTATAPSQPSAQQLLQAKRANK